MKFLVRSLASALLLTGCVTHPESLVLDSVGPAPRSSHTTANHGSLVVYTAFDVHANLTGGFPEHRHYTDYKIVSADGNLVQVVHNDGGNVAESPVAVELSPGSYRVIARASRYGTVQIPIVIASSQTTVVHLDGAAGAVASRASSEAVRLPDGQFVGWRSSTEKLVGTAAPVAASR